MTEKSTTTKELASLPTPAQAKKIQEDRWERKAMPWILMIDEWAKDPERLSTEVLFTLHNPRWPVVALSDGKREPLNTIDARLGLQTYIARWPRSGDLCWKIQFLTELSFKVFVESEAASADLLRLAEM